MEVSETTLSDAECGPYNRNGNLVHALLKDGLSNTGKFLPSNCKKLGILEATGIHPNYMGSGLLQYLYALSIKAFADQECDHFSSYCVATGTYKIGKRVSTLTKNNKTEASVFFLGPNF